MEIGDLIARNLAELIKAKGTNDSAVALAANMGHTGVRDIITRKSKNPTYAKLVRIAGVLNVDIREITSGPKATQGDDDSREILNLLSQLSATEREFLLKSARGLAAGHSQPNE